MEVEDKTNTDADADAAAAADAADADVANKHDKIEKARVKYAEAVNAATTEYLNVANEFDEDEHINCLESMDTINIGGAAMHIVQSCVMLGLVPDPRKFAVNCANIYVDAVKYFADAAEKNSTLIKVETPELVV
jgi:hypothetical protein